MNVTVSENLFALLISSMVCYSDSSCAEWHTYATSNYAIISTDNDLFEKRPLYEPMLAHYQLELWKPISVKYESLCDNFHSRTLIWKCDLDYGGHCVSAHNTSIHNTINYRRIQQAISQNWQLTDIENICHFQYHHIHDAPGYSVPFGDRLLAHFDRVSLVWFKSSLISL